MSEHLWTVNIIKGLKDCLSLHGIYISGIYIKFRKIWKKTMTLSGDFFRKL